MPKSLKEIQEKYIPIYLNQSKPVQKKARVSIAILRSIEVVLHPMLKRY